MVMSDYDHDVVRWGLHLLQPDLCSISTDPEIIDRSAVNSQPSVEGNKKADVASVENDEVIAIVLQEEFEQIALAEKKRTLNADEERMQASVLSQNWPGLPSDDSQLGSEPLEVSDDAETSNSSSASVENLDDGEEWSSQLADELSALDGEVCKRLNQMTPVPHVPKINGDIPSEDEAISDHQRLLDRLKVYYLVELKVQGDGNCQFRALSHQLYQTPEYHQFVRSQVVDQLNSHPEIYEGYVPMAFHEYLEKMSKTGEWGDHVTLQAAADSYGVKIFILTSFKDTCYIEILPNIQKSERVIFLSFWAEVHYNSISPEGEIWKYKPNKKKKRWWNMAKWL